MQNALKIAFSRKPMYNFRILLNRGQHDLLAPSHDPSFAEVVPSCSSVHLELGHGGHDCRGSGGLRGRALRRGRDLQHCQVRGGDNPQHLRV